MRRPAGLNEVKRTGPGQGDRGLFPGFLRVPIGILLIAGFLAIVPHVRAFEVAGDAVDLMERERVHYAAGGGFAIALLDPVGGERPFTLRTHLRLGSAAALEDAGEIWMLALRPALEEDLLSFAVGWVKDTSGWWPRWRLQVLRWNEQGEADVLFEVDAAPTAEHSYETFASFDPQTGTVGVRVADLATGELVMANAYRARALRIAGYPAVSAETAASVDAAANAGAADMESAPAEAWETPVEASPKTRAEALAFTLYDLYVPVAMTWRVEAGSDPAGSFVPVRVLGAEDHARIRIVNPLPVGRGNFRILLADRQEVFATADGGTEEALIPLDQSALAIGASALLVEFVEGGAVRLQDASTITVGSASIYISPVNVDREAGVIEADLRLTSTHAAPGMKLDVSAELYRMTWDAASKAYEYTLYRTESAYVGTIDVDPGVETVVPLRLALPSEEGLWSIAFEPVLDPALGVTLVGDERHLSTYAPFDASRGRPFTIAVLPDTQYYARSYPDIFIRQAQWIAQNAASRNIALVLHVGDITDNNTAAQWERARDSMGILHGVVPYVLVAGNHDILTGRVADREKTLIDAYFPQSLFPALKGTFGRGISNSYHTVEIGGEKYLIVALEFGPRDIVLDWANEVVASHPDHKAIIVTHTYTARNGRRVSPGTSGGSPELVLPSETSDVNNGEEMWSKFVRKHPNIVMVVSGHIGANTIPHNVGLGANRNFVYEFLTDFQSEENGGNGWLALFQFEQDGEVVIRTYSPYIGAYKTDRDKYGFANHMIVDMERARVESH